MAFAMAPGAALADTYTGTGAPIAGAVESNVLSRPSGVQSGAAAGRVQSANTGSTSSASSLPVTGSDVASLALIGFGVLGVGTVLVLKTRTRTPEPA
jgi:LPXTG-motif cell wall-anchored protein